MNRIFLVIKGAAMGVAEAIPGVSGGTIAFITGIYEELIDTIKCIHPGNLRKLIKDPKEFWSLINGSFLAFLLAGMAIGIGFGVMVISHLLDTQKELLWAFFFGIVLASGIYFARQIKWNYKFVGIGILGFIISFGVTILTPSDGSHNLIYIFLAGTVAVSALMLPGLSGSFILLLLGLYETIIDSVKDLITNLATSQTLITLAVFGAGILVGLFSFARVLSYLFKRFYTATMAFMIGILLGSLNKLWPWKLIETAMNRETKEIEVIGRVHLNDPELYKIVTETNLSPTAFGHYSDPKSISIIVAFSAGILLIILMSQMTKGQESTS